MLGLHRNKIIRLCLLLRSLGEDPKSLSTLSQLQREIINSIRQTEHRIDVLRNNYASQKRALKTQRLPREGADRIKRLIKRTNGLIKKNQWLLTVWRSFGDGIAFTYLDPWSIKPLMYNIADPDVKPHAGSLRGKQGIRTELLIIKKLTEAGIPSVLSDSTNCIRYGDVCILYSPYPYPIEVKSSSNQNARTERQLENLQSIHDYLATDRMTNVRGAPEVRRIALPFPEEDFRHIYDQAISGAIEQTVFISEPEPGVRLVALTSSHQDIIQKGFSGFNIDALYSVNQFKYESNWGVYFPYTLSIRQPENLIAFLEGSVSIYIMHDFEAIGATARKFGTRLTLTGEPEWPIQLERIRKKKKSINSRKVSCHFTTRMAIELLSWNWLFRVEKHWSDNPPTGVLAPNA